MRYQQLNLTTAKTVQVLSGECQFSAYRQRIIETHPDTLKIKFADQELILERAIDNGRTADWPNLYLIWGESDTSFLTVGGELVYKVNILQKQVDELLEFRDSYFSGLWDLQLVEFRDSLVVIGESDVMRIDKQLNILWHVLKGLDDSYVRQENDALVFMWDYNETEWRLNLITGEKLGWIDNNDIVPK